MHRSGTSMLSSYINSLGFELGNNETKDKDDANPLGYFENYTFTTAHDNLLSHNGCTWQLPPRPNLEYTDYHVQQYVDIIGEEFNSNKISIKDPRLSFFVDLLDEVSERLQAKTYYLFATRNKSEVVDSLRKVQRVQKNEAEALYDITHECLRPNMLEVSYNKFLAEPKEVRKEICEFLKEKDSKSVIVDDSLYRIRK